MRNRTVIPKIRRKYLKRLAAAKRKRDRKIKEVENKIDGIEFLTTGRNFSFRIPYYHMKRDGSWILKT